jgi:uncharacterized membrane protein
MSDKTKFWGFHVRQGLSLHILFIIVSYIGVFSWIPFVGWILTVVTIVFIVMGLISAIQGQEKELPLVGAWAQNWFKGI